MKEITRIITVEITAIRKVDDDCIPMEKNDASEVIKAVIRANFNTDNVNVVGVQDFIRDLDVKGE